MNPVGLDKGFETVDDAIIVGVVQLEKGPGADTGAQRIAAIGGDDRAVVFPKVVRCDPRPENLDLGLQVPGIARIQRITENIAGLE
ncbi:hypothetical protein D3C77_520520 [compost metagenome]